MLELQLPETIATRGKRGRPLRILCLGAHCDDIDIGCGATLLKLLSEHPGTEVTWVAFSATEERARELQASAKQFLRAAGNFRVITHQFRDAYFPGEYTDIKRAFEPLKQLNAPDIVFTHQRDDRHQDHRVISELTWNAFRRHLVLEYEIPKYDGGLSTPNVYVRLGKVHVERKIRILLSCYRSQREKPWFTEETFRALMRLRGIEAGGDAGWAEGFHAHKLCVG